MNFQSHQLSQSAWLRMRWVLPAIVMISVLLRLGSAFFYGNDLEALPGVYDQVSYHELSVRVLNGDGFSFGSNWWPATRAGEPTAHWSFLYTLYLAFVYSMTGSSLLAARILQVLIVGSLQPWLCWRIGNRLFGAEAGVAAALLVSLYGYFIYYAGALVTESFYILAVLWALDRATSIAAHCASSEKEDWSNWALLGLATGTAVLLRQVFLFFVPLMLAWLAYVYLSRRCEDIRVLLRRLLIGVITTGLILLVLILPWTIRNYSAFGKFVLLNTNAGFAFYWGNHPIHGSDFVPILSSETYGRLIPDELRHLDEAALDRALLLKGLEFVRQDPGRYFLLSLSRAKEYFKCWPSRESSLASNLVRVFSFGILLPFMVLGLLVSSQHYFGESRCATNRWGWLFTRGHVLLILFATFYTIMHLLSWTLIRYRLPVDAVFILYAGVGTTWLLREVSFLRDRFFESECQPSRSDS